VFRVVILAAFAGALAGQQPPRPPKQAPAPPMMFPGPPPAPKQSPPPIPEVPTQPKDKDKATPAATQETDADKLDARAPRQAGGQSSAGVLLNVQGASLIDIVDMLARQLRINYILDPRVKGSVIINTYGEIRNVGARALLEAILRINGAAIIQVGDVYRIVPVAEAGRLPIEPQVDAKAFPDDERMMLNLVFLKYATVGELFKLPQPFVKTP
jgi:general secretion pathway protein D